MNGFWSWHAPKRDSAPPPEPCWELLEADSDRLDSRHIVSTPGTRGRDMRAEHHDYQHALKSSTEPSPSESGLTSRLFVLTRTRAGRLILWPCSQIQDTI